MKSVLRAVGLGGRTKPRTKVMLPTSDPVMMRLPAVEGVAGMLAYCKSGKGRGKAVCIHGCPGSVRDFRYVSPHLEEGGVEVLRLDLPGHGDSRDVKIVGREPCVEAMAEVAVNACRDVFGSLDDCKPLICAHSLGSHIALEMMRLYPTSFSGIVLLAPAGLYPHRSLQPWWLIRPIATYIRQNPTSPLTTLTSYLLPTIYRSLGFPPLPTSEYLYSQSRISLIDYPKFTLSVSSHPVKTPLLMVYAANDPVCNKAVADDLVEALRTRYEGSEENLHVMLYEDGGHAVQKAHAEEIVKTIFEKGLVHNVV